jgi:prepilin-type N-terminal cleavage/methylation domain-containing protein
MSKRASKGFTLIEMVVATALIAGFATMTVPLVSKLQRAQEFRSITRGIAANLMNARSVASSGKREQGWSTNDRVTQAGLIVNSSTSYTIFVDRDNARDGDELPFRIVNLPVGMEITAPLPGQEIRFRHNGTVVAPMNITVVDRVRVKTRTLILSGGGAIRIN